MPKVKIEDVERITGYKVKRNSKAIGIDLATKTGVSIIKSNGNFIDIDYSVLNFSNKKDIRYEQVVDLFKLIIRDKVHVVIEDTYSNPLNRGVSLLLSRLGGIPLCLSILRKDEGVTYSIIGAISARTKIGINTKEIPKGQSKIFIISWLNKSFGLNLKEDNEADATILGLLGILEGLDFRSKTAISKSKKLTTKKTVKKAIKRKVFPKKKKRK